MTIQQRLQKHPKTHLIFDFDETLFWLVFNWDKFSEMMRKRLVPLDRDLYRQFEIEKRSLSGTLNAYIERYGVEAKQIITSISMEFERKYLEKAVPNPELIDFVREHKDTYRMYIWTSNTSKVVERVLKEYKLKDVFKKIASQREITFLKPFPDGFIYLREKDVSLSRYLMIGNSQADEKAAKEVGIEYFHVDYFTTHAQAD